MHETTELLLKLCPASLREAMADSSPVRGNILSLGQKVFELGDRSYDVDQVYGQIARAVADGRAPVADLDGRPGELRLLSDRKGLVLKDEGNTALVDGLLLGSNDPALRKRALDELLSRAWLGPHQAVLRKRAAARAFTAPELDALQHALARTIEYHLTDVVAQLKDGNPQYRGLEWTHRREIELLVGDAASATDIAALGDGLMARRAARLRDQLDARTLAVALSVTVDGSWAVRPVPKGLTAEALVEAACPNGVIADPFAALAGLEIAVRAGGRFDSAFAEILDVLERDTERLLDQLAVYAGAVVVAYASLALNAETRGTPVIWRRCAAFATAGFHSRALVGLGAHAQGFFAGARQTYGTWFDTAVARDAVITPRWRALFATPGALLGLWWRRLTLVQALVQAPDRIARMQALATRTINLGETPAPQLSVWFPSPLHGFRTDSVLPEVSQMADTIAVDGVAPERRAVQWRALVNSGLIAPPTEKTAERCADLIRDTTVRELIDEANEIPPEITAAAHLVATLGRPDLAQQLAGKMIAAATSETAKWPMIQAVQALLALAAANSEPEAYVTALRDSLETLAYAVRDNGEAAKFVAVLDLLMQMDPALMPELSRARIVGAAFAAA